jgi:hypothetical protein
MPPLSEPSTASAAGRRWPRLVPDRHISVVIPSLRVTLTLRDLSVGGFAVSAPRPFTVGITHRFLFSTESGVEITIVAKAMHCHSRPTDAHPLFITGWQFMAGSMDENEAAINRLLG